MNKLGFGQKVALELLWGLCKWFAWHPYWFRYRILQPIVCGFFRLVRYRDGVVRKNLLNSFPEKTDKERDTIRKGFYRTLSEIVIDTVSMAGFSDEDCRKVMRFSNLQDHIERVQGRDWICMTAHMGCWEYVLYWGVVYPEQASMGVYHPLNSRVFDRLYLRLRTRPNIHLVTMNNTVRYYLRHRETGIDGKRIAMGLIADQSPRRRPDLHWFRFLNQDTHFFDGGEKLALRFGLPVYCVWPRRIAPGRYTAHFDRIYDGKEPVAPNEITERYVRLLEQRIRETPELWMWSHKRWKHVRASHETGAPVSAGGADNAKEDGRS